MRLCILGGAGQQRGGLEAYCERAEAAIRCHATDLAVVHMRTDSAYLAPGRIGRFIARLMDAWRARKACDLVWLQVSNLPDLAFILVVRAARKPLLVTPHFGANSRLQTSGWRRALCRWALGFADRLGLLFDDQAREISLPDGPPRETVGTFLPAAAFAHRDPADPQELATLGLIHAARFSEGKGSFAMIDVCATLRDRGIAFSARLVGHADPHTMDRLRRSIADKGLSAQISITPWLDERDMHEALRRADVLVHLSRLDSFPLIVLEALAAGALPLISSMRGADSMVASFGGHVVTQSAAAEAAAAWIAGTPLEELRTQGELARQRVQEALGWQRIVRTLAEVFSRTLVREGCPGG